MAPTLQGRFLSVFASKAEHPKEEAFKQETERKMEMKEKYVTERFPYWFEFGKAADGSGRVGVSSGQDDICLVPKNEADNMIAERAKVIDMLVRLADALDRADHKVFSHIWYGSAL